MKSITRRDFLKGMMVGGVAAGSAGLLSACGSSSSVAVSDGEFQEVDASELEFPLAETATISGMISYPSGTDEDISSRTIFKRIQEATNVEVEWTAIQSDQWGDKITLAMANLDTLTDFVFTASFGDAMFIC